MIELLYSGPTTPQGQAPSTPFTDTSRKEFLEHTKQHRMDLATSEKQLPRRSRTQHQYQIPQPPAAPAIAVRQHTPVAEPSPSGNEQKQPTAKAEQPVPRRPPLGPPRRSHSVMDYEPLPHHHRPSSRLALMDVPVDVHYAIFDFLDPIDSACMGLTNKHFYAIHRRMHGTVPLTARRDGPNELEWAWHLAGQVVKTTDGLIATTDNTLGKNALSSLRVRGQAYCRKCGITRCELQKHIQEWMGDQMEYCSIRRKFGPAAPEGARLYCYMSKPDDPHRCGRHRVRKTKVVLQ